MNTLASTDSGSAWYDNRPCDRYGPGFVRTVIAAVGAVMGVVGVFLGAMLMVALGADIAEAVAVGLLWTVGGCGAFYVFVSGVEQLAPLEVFFGTSEIGWRTRQGKVHYRRYDELISVISSQWKGDRSDGQCRKWVAIFPAKFRGARLLFARSLVWLNPANKERLDQTIREGHGRQS